MTPRQLRTTVVGALVVALAAIAAVVLVADDEPRAAPTTGASGSEEPTDIGAVTVNGSIPAFDGSEPDPAVGRDAPTVTALDSAGRSAELSPGVARLIVFATHSCAHCQRQIPRLVEWYDDGMFPDNVEPVIVMTYSDPDQPNWPPSKWLSDAGWTGRTIADSEATEIARVFGVGSVPGFVAIDADGIVTARAEGELDRDAVEELIESM